jgi:uncharacterized protein
MLSAPIDVIPRAVEFVLLFLAVPLAFTYLPVRLPAIPALWALCAYCSAVLLNDPSFDRRQLWNAAAFCRDAVEVLGLFAVIAVTVAAWVYWYSHDLFLNFPRTNTWLWGLVMILYPVLSVYPQGIIYRAFVFQRYRSLFATDWGIVAASAFAFAFVHIVFRNRIALVFTALGGMLFGLRYLQTKSLFISSFEHALYGCLMFTVGLGQSFYHGAARTGR